MRTIVMLMAVSMLMIVAAPAYSAEAVHVYWCEEGDLTQPKRNWKQLLRNGSRLQRQ